MKPRERSGRESAILISRNRGGPMGHIGRRDIIWKTLTGLENNFESIICDSELCLL
jgi:hypothetical protein